MSRQFKIKELLISLPNIKKKDIEGCLARTQLDMVNCRQVTIPDCEVTFEPCDNTLPENCEQVTLTDCGVTYAGAAGSPPGTHYGTRCSDTACACCPCTAKKTNDDKLEDFTNKIEGLDIESLVVLQQQMGIIMEQIDKKIEAHVPSSEKDFDTLEKELKYGLETLAELRKKGSSKG
ncbi:MAG: hypothetical protein AAGF77_01765 [Bacteroidota bacterium]